MASCLRISPGTSPRRTNSPCSRPHSKPSSRAFGPEGGCSRLKLSLHVCDHLIGAVKRAEGAPGFDIGQAFGEPGIDDAPLLGRVFVICGWQLWNDVDHTAGDLEFHLIALFRAGPASHL